MLDSAKIIYRHNCTDIVTNCFSISFNIKRGLDFVETTKDLGRALGMMVYVFNCSEQMDYKSCGNIYKVNLAILKATSLLKIL